jgi:hypothetical protein
MEPLDSKSPKSNTQGTTPFAFAANNYRLLLIGIGILILGYALMVGGGSDDPEVFSEEIFSTRRITIAPIVVLIGYGAIFYAILKQPKPTEKV